MDGIEIIRKYILEFAPNFCSLQMVKKFDHPKIIKHTLVHNSKASSQVHSSTYSIQSSHESSKITFSDSSFTNLPEQLPNFISKNIIQRNIASQSPNTASFGTESSHEQNTSFIQQEKLTPRQQIARRELYDILQNCGVKISLNETELFMKIVFLERFPTGASIVSKLLSTSKQIKGSSMTNLNEGFKKWIDMDEIETIRKYIFENASKYCSSQLMNKSCHPKLIKHTSVRNSNTSSGIEKVSEAVHQLFCHEHDRFDFLENDRSHFLCNL
jgi:hypothetical protein